MEEKFLPLFVRTPLTDSWGVWLFHWSLTLSVAKLFAGVSVVLGLVCKLFEVKWLACPDVSAPKLLAAAEAPESLYYSLKPLVRYVTEGDVIGTHTPLAFVDPKTVGA